MHRQEQGRDGAEERGDEYMLDYEIKSSPFLELENPFTCWEGAKMALLLPLALIRIVAMAVVLLVFALVSTLATAGWPMHKPLSPPRRRLVLASRWLGGLVLALLGFWVHVDKARNIRDAQAAGVKLLVFNHTSWVDTIVLLFLFAPSGVSRASNAAIPVVGSCIKSFQNISVPSSSLTRQRTSPLGSTAANQLLVRSGTAKTVVEQVTERLREPGWPIIGIAPEGTTSNGRGLLQFRTGAFVHGEPVLPVCISYSRHPVNPAWTLGNEPWHFLRMLCQFGHVVRVEVLPAYTPSSTEASSPTLYAENVRQLMADALHVPLIEQSHEHYTAVAAQGITTNWMGKLVIPAGVRLDDRGRANLKRPVNRRR